MMRTKLSRALALFLALLMACGCFSFAAFAAAENEATSSRRTMQEWNEILNTDDYEEYIADHANAPRGTRTVTIDATKYVADKTTDKGVKVMSDVSGDAGKSLYTSASGKVTWSVNVPEAGMYTVELFCYPGDALLEEGDTEKSTDVERILYVNGKVPFSEARSITVTKGWAPIYTAQEDGTVRFRKDIAGNDIRPDNVSAIEWVDYTVKDSTGYYKEALQFYFEKGEKKPYKKFHHQSSRSFLMSSFDIRPTEVLTSEPPLKTIRVGMLIILNCIASSPSSSMLIFPTFISGISSETSSTIGDSILHGPHHDAQKSTNTGTSDFKTSSSKLFLLSSIIAILILLFDKRKAAYKCGFCK